MHSSFMHSGYSLSLGIGKLSMFSPFAAKTDKKKE